MSRRRPNGAGTVYQRKDGRWCGQATLAGPPAKRVTVYAHTRAEVLKKLGMIESSAPASDTKVSIYVEQWLATAKLRIAPATLKRYTLSLGYITPLIGGYTLGQLQTSHVNAALIAVASKVSADAARKAGAMLQQVLGAAVEAGELERNVARAASLPRAPRHGRFRALTAEEAQKLLRAAQGSRLYPFYVTALDTGARLRELMALTWDDWHPGKRTLRFNKSLKQDCHPYTLADLKTRAGLRTIKVSLSTAEVLESIRPTRIEGGLNLLFPSPRSHGYMHHSHFYLRSFYPLLERAGLPRIRFHDLRHTCATLLLGAGVDVRTVAARLGHASPSITLNVYGHVLPAMEERAATEMDKILGLGVDS